MTNLDSPATMNKKLLYLVFLQSGYRFLTIEMPLFNSYGLNTKGFFLAEDKANLELAEYQKLIENQPKDTIKEVMFPWHMVQYTVNLMFKAKER